MLTKFEVMNFKNFKENITLDLTKPNNYEFNKECIVDGIINKAMIYGHNASGKSNLGFAIFDIIAHTTDKEKGSELYNHYLCASSNKKIANFRYEFKFKDGVLRYEYGKENLEKLVYEKICINSKDFASIDRRENSVATINAVGAETLKKDLGTSQISLVSYIKNNSVLETNQDNSCFESFVNFVNDMIFFRSLRDNNYIGYQQGSSTIDVEIVKKGKVELFEKFLNDMGIDCKIKAIERGNNPSLAFDFGKKQIPFYDIASNGTQALTLFFYWHLHFTSENKPSFIFIDEFDAYYHHALSKMLVKMLMTYSAQTIITTHNVSIMTNDLLRPDCYFQIGDGKITSLAEISNKELREAHNIEKMYRAGTFNG